MEVYTFVSNPFRMGGPQHDVVKTKVEEYERIKIGKGYFGIVFKNSVKLLWHVALEDCGALIMTDNTRQGAVNKVKLDVENGCEKVMEDQIKKGKRDLAKALLIPFDDWCEKFKV